MDFIAPAAPAPDQLGRSKTIIMKTKDRISALPDSVLVYILSLIPFKSVVRTSTLSRRWRELCKELWAYKSTLDFGKEFAGRQTPEEFTINVNRFLQLHTGKEIEKFHIFFYPGEAYETDVKNWIRFATEKGVQELDLDFSQRSKHPRDHDYTVDGFADVRKPSQLPLSCVFNCGSLKHLQLRLCHLYPCINLDRSTSLQSLRSINFRQVGINEDDLRSLLNCCPHLETLALRECEQLGQIHVSSSVPSLRCLCVVDCVCSIKIDAPTLISFHFHGVLYYMDLVDVSSLVDAFVSSGAWHDEPQHFSSIMRNLVNVKVLTICTEALQGFVIPEENLPENFPMTFPNLQEIQLLILCESDLEEIYDFFRLCPCPLLQSLFIELPFSGGFVETEAVEVPSECVFDHLKIVKMKEFRGREFEIQLVKFFLLNAIGLKSIILVAPQSVPGEPDVPLALLRWLLKEASVCNQIVLCIHPEDDTFFPTHIELYS